MDDISLEEGKYVIHRKTSGRMYADRYGKPWRELTGDNLILGLIHALEEKEAALKAQGEPVDSERVAQLIAHRAVDRSSRMLRYGA